MKKILAAILALAMLFAACASLAESADAPLFATVGDALKEAEERSLPCVGEDYYSVVVKTGGKYIRVIAEPDETLMRLQQEEQEEEDFEKKEAIFGEFWKHCEELTVVRTEEITAKPITQEELDTYAGKTYADLAESTLNPYMGSLVDENPQEGGAEGLSPDAMDAVVRVEEGLFTYDFTLDITRGEYMERAVNDRPMDSVAVKSAVFAGISSFAADLEYNADGTGGMSLLGDMESMGLSGDMAVLMEKLMELMSGKDVSEIDPETLINALVQAVPEQEETIRMLVPAMMEYLETNPAEE